MIRKLVCSMFVMTVAIGFVCADDYFGVVTKVDGDKITFQKMTKAKKGAKSEKEGDPVVLTVDKDTKYFTKKYNKDDKKFVEDDLKDGIKAEVFTKIDPEKGVNATITTEGDKKVATKVVIGGGKKGGKGAQ
jgi:biopolymer transport protein ExbD